MKEGHRYTGVPPRRGAPFPPGPEEVPLCAAARAPRDFASETFRGFCGRARGTGGGKRGKRGKHGKHGMRGGCEGRRERERSEVEERVGWEDNSIPVN